MGRPLVEQLSLSNYVYVTSRKPHVSTEKVKYLIGNAKDLVFLSQILAERHYEAIVDFMVWTEEFARVSQLMLYNTDQYIFISSARVYAQSDEPITEVTPRLLDTSEDKEYLSTNEYALAKAREENLLLHSGRNNYTIIRPTITYNSRRLQLGVFEKENWLYRVLKGRSIVFSSDIADKITTMTWGEDVSRGIASLIGEQDAIGEVFHITCPSSFKWREILDTYLDVLEQQLGKRPKVVMTEKSTCFYSKSRFYQIIYCRYFNRSFDNSKIGRFCDISKFINPKDGLSICLREFLKNPSFDNIDWALEGVNDRVAGERTPLAEIHPLNNKVEYLCYRYDLKSIRWIKGKFGDLYRSVVALRH